MSIIPIDWANRPRKYCFAPCPDGKFCECRERRKWERLHQRRETKLITKREHLAAALEGKGCLGKAADDEPVFILRAQDNLAADMVEQWAIRAESQGTPYDKVREAFDIVEHMRRWPIHKNAD